MTLDRLNNFKFAWKGLALHYGRRKLLTVVPDANNPHLYRITYPNG